MLEVLKYSNIRIRIMNKFFFIKRRRRSQKVGMTMMLSRICIDVWVWLGKTIYTNCLIVSLCIAGIFLLMEFQIHTCKKEKKNNADRYKTTVSALYYDSPSSNDIFNRRSYAKLLLNKLYSSFYSNNSQEPNLRRLLDISSMGSDHESRHFAFLKRESLFKPERLKRISCTSIR